MPDFHHEDSLGVVRSSSRTLTLSIVVVALVPILCFILASLDPSFSLSHPELSYGDIIAELFLLILFLSWILIIAMARLRSRAYFLLLIGFSTVATAIGVDVMDEFLTEDSSVLSVLENLAYPVGMLIASAGLWRWSQDYRSLLLRINSDRLEWRARASHDDLTGQLNRRYFFDELPVQIKQHQHDCRPAFLFMLDIDHFKTVNDNYGHPVGDRLLELYGKEINGFLRKDDLGFRLGGEEFALVIHDASALTAVEAAERLKNQLGQLSVVDNHSNISRTCSIGIAELQRGEDVHAWLKRADQALYRAKDQGRNQVVMSDYAP